MDKYRAALFCYINQLCSRENVEQELQHQQNLLERYANIHGIAVFTSYLYIGSDRINLNDPVISDMLQDAKRGDFDIILSKHFEPFMTFFSIDLPFIRLFSVTEKKQIELGKKDIVQLDENPIPVFGAAVYIREGTSTYQRTFRF
ncbi:recombinase family protein [Faecalispora sporosphaeroides]|uniref:recombinase family protein n=1 Tax=Faecalispora sporosphaeroides TaxID=1549 RepID=UPI000381F203|nr:recombinase family protein [Faecalispora sporosphaeroides]